MAAIMAVPSNPSAPPRPPPLDGISLVADFPFFLFPRQPQPTSSKIVQGHVSIIAARGAAGRIGAHLCDATNFVVGDLTGGRGPEVSRILRCGHCERFYHHYDEHVLSDLHLSVDRPDRGVHVGL